MSETRRPKFSLGQIVATPGALEAIRDSGESPADFLARHVSGDWGDDFAMTTAVSTTWP